MRRLPYVCFAALILAAFAGAWWMRPTFAPIDPTTFHSIEDSMTLDELRAMLGEPFGVVENDEGVLVPAVLGSDSRWIIERRSLVADKINPHGYPHEGRKEWVGERWGISVSFDAKGKMGSRMLWKLAK